MPPEASSKKVVAAIRFKAGFEEEARALSAEFGVPLENKVGEAEVTAFIDESGVTLIDAEDRSLKMDFASSKFYQRKGLRGKSEILVKALGIRKAESLVFDLSGGFLIDSAFLANLNFKVHAFERNPVVFLTMRAALESGRKELPYLDNIRFHSLDAISACEKYFATEKPQALYFDPMFPEKKKALSKLPMQIFQSLVGKDEDAEAVLEEILRRFSCRIVVKRPLKAPELVKKPTHSFTGSTVRYDMYAPIP